jgi:hypothetical protein
VASTDFSCRLGTRIENCSLQEKELKTTTNKDKGKTMRKRVVVIKQKAVECTNKVEKRKEVRHRSQRLLLIFVYHVPVRFLMDALDYRKTR